ncbi:MAG: C4-dicarboxylate TRAP transporter large permease protein DctM [Myxococcota bacterium]|nr:C4-dicarboxylate TRAP transporter large permease protein DctM [Myxococcota bacterium]
MIALTGLAIVVMALLGQPLFLVLGAAALLLLYAGQHDFSGFTIAIMKLVGNPVLLAIPLFTFAGYMMAESKTPVRLVNLAKALVGWMPGGIALVALLSCAFFTAFTGASGVTIIALGGLLLPILVAEKYPEKFALGLITSSGSLGLLFPPSLPIILYGVVSGARIDSLFSAGVLPGIVLIAILGVYSAMVARRAGVKQDRFVPSELWLRLKEAKWELPLPVIVMGGIYGGVYTASQAAVVTVAYVFFVEVIVHKDIRLTRDLPRIMREAMVLIGGIIIILTSAIALTDVLILEEIPQAILNFMKQYITSRFMFLLVLNIFLLIVGCLMDIFSAIVVVVPLITAIALGDSGYNINPVHLGIIFLANLEIGYFTPPVGMNLFLSSFRFRKPVLELYRATAPFLLVYVIGLAVITYVEDLSLALVKEPGSMGAATVNDAIQQGESAATGASGSAPDDDLLKDLNLEGGEVNLDLEFEQALGEGAASPPPAAAPESATPAQEVQP